MRTATDYRRPVSRLLVTLALATLAGCATSRQVCTLLACLDGISVEVNGNVQGSYSVSVSPSGGPTQRFDCQVGAACNNFLAGVQDAQVTLQITTSSGTVTRVVQPTYQTVYPNGPQCGGACRQGHVTVTL